VVKPSEISQHLEAGDRLLIHEKSGRTLELDLTGIVGDLLYGTLPDDAGTRVQVAMNDIETIDVEKIDGVKTTLAVVGGTYLSLFAVFLVLLATGGLAFMP